MPRLPRTQGSSLLTADVTFRARMQAYWASRQAAPVAAIDDGGASAVPTASVWGRTSNRGTRGYAGPQLPSARGLPEPADQEAWPSAEEEVHSAAAAHLSDSDWDGGDAAGSDQGLSEADSDYEAAAAARGSRSSRRNRSQIAAAPEGRSRRITATIQMGDPGYSAAGQLAAGSSRHPSGAGRRLKINFQR